MSGKCQHKCVDNLCTGVDLASGEDRTVYIISSHTKESAELIARSIGLKQRDWVYLSKRNISHREQNIHGLRSTPDKLIGIKKN